MLKLYALECMDSLYNQVNTSINDKSSEKLQTCSTSLKVLQRSVVYRTTKILSLDRSSMAILPYRITEFQRARNKR